MDVRTGPSVTVLWRLWTPLLGELCKRALRLPKWYSNTASMIIMDCQSAEARCLTRKLCFLLRITDSSDTISSRTLVAPWNEIESICLIRECLELEEHLNTNFRHSLLIFSSNPESGEEDRPSTRQIKDQLLETINLFSWKSAAKWRTQDALLTLQGWFPGRIKLWDLALNDGPKCVNALRAFVRIMLYPSHSRQSLSRLWYW